MEKDQRLYQIAFTLIKRVGPILGRNLLTQFETPEALFKEKAATLDKTPGFPHLSSDILAPGLLERAEKELAFIEKNGIRMLFYTDNDYPFRLNECVDAPLLLFSKGEMDFNQKRVISIVGTRHATPYGKGICAELLKELAATLPDLLICSGLAYGIDITAHKEALANHLPTIGVLGHGLDRIYPAAHRKTAVEMLGNGALLTEFMSGTEPDRSNFVMRNRIIAGMADATVVIESADKGGSLITANIAVSYNRDVLAVPGRSTDPYSQGCNQLIRDNKAALIQTADDLLRAMQWIDLAPSKPRQRELFVELTEEEERVVQILTDKEQEHINQIVIQSNISIGQISSILLNLEMKGVIRSLPGCQYARI